MESLRLHINNYFKKIDIKGFSVNNGNTQAAERKVIEHMENLFNEISMTYVKAGSQQSKDFRCINGTNKNIEVKIVTNKFDIIFNDTIPSADTDYIIFFTGKTYKKQIYVPQILLVNGKHFVEESKEWVDEVNNLLSELKDKYCRGQNKKNLKGLMRCYFRPTWSSTIFPFINNTEFTVYKSNQPEV
jgi:hypothetical protein